MQHLNIPRWCYHFHPYTAILDIANVAEEITMTMLADGKDGYGGQCGPALQHHLLPLLPRHHRLPRTPGQQVPFFLEETNWEKVLVRYLQHLFAEHNIMHEVQSVINRTL